jgi:hypothetical protein
MAMINALMTCPKMHPGLAKQLNKLARSIDILPKIFYRPERRRKTS